MQNYDRDHALTLDEHDPLKHLRKEFIIPSKDDLISKTIFSPCKIHFLINTVTFQIYRGKKPNF